jgi:hypothetical protein
MPPYLRKTLEDFNRDFFRCAMNPNGYIFQCAFCGDFYKTKAGRLYHMKRCEENNEDEYDEESMLDERLSVAVYLQNEGVKHNLIKRFIRTNELEALATRTSSQIRAYIKGKLIEGGFEVFTTNEDFLIYKFFFEVSEEEWNAEIENWTNKIMDDFDF